MNTLVEEQKKNNRNSKNPFISCIVPVFNEESLICKFLWALSEKLSQESEAYEILVIDDGSSDQTANKVKSVIKELPVHLISLSRNFGKESALTAGLECAKGDVVIIMDGDFQHPFETITHFMEKWREGYDMVYAVRKDRLQEAFLKRVITNNFYRFLKIASGVEIPPNAGDFRLMDRTVVDAVNKLPERKRFMKGIYAWVGYRTTSVTFDVVKRLSGESSWNKIRLINLALTGITSFTELPLRLVALFGIFISFFSFLFGIYILISTLMFGNNVAGWPTLINVVAFLGGFQLFATGFLGEYIAGIFAEVKRRPNYIIKRREHRDMKKNQADSTN